eukprot:7394852-Prorocentrum_lima.AAC.1
MGGTTQGEIRSTKGYPQHIDLVPYLGRLTRIVGLQIVRLQSDNGGEFINEPFDRRVQQDR